MTLREIDGGTDYFEQFNNSLPSDPNFFPIGVWLESVTTQADINLDKDVGLNTYVALTRNSNLSLVQSNGMYAILQANEWLENRSGWPNNQAALDSPATVGWLLADEIDMTQGPGQGYTSLNNILASLPDDGRFRYDNYGKGVMFWETDAEAERFVNDFQQVTSVDTYWFTDPNIDGGSEGGSLLNNGNPLSTTQTRLAANYGYTVDHLRELDAMDGDLQPIWNFVEVGWPFTESAAQGGRQILPAEITAAVWHSIIAGAQGIIYFNHSFGGTEQTQHALRDSGYAAERAAVDSTDALIEQLAPVLNSPFDDGFVSVNSSVRAMAKYYNGEHYVFAGATVNGAATSTDSFTLAGVSSGAAEVIGENRTIAIVNGQFADTFADGNAIHIYRIITDGGTPTPSAPTITSNGGGAGASVTIQENTTAVTTVVATDPDSASITYSISGGADAARFTINATTGALAFVAAPNFDSPTDSGNNNVYDVQVRASDGSLNDTQSIAVTVANNDAAAIAGSVSISDATISEGNSGTKVATFTVTRSGGTAAFDVNFATSNATATVTDNDYAAASNMLHFGANQNTQTFSVTVNGDTKVEGNETFNVALSNPTNGATIRDSQGIGTITNDDGATAQNLVINGGFESGNFNGWTLSGNSGGNQIYIAPTAFPGGVHSGTYSAGLGSMNRTDGVLTQSIATTAGQHYTLSFWIQSDNDGSTPINHFAAEWNGQTLMAVTDAPNSGYQLYTFDVVGVNGNSVLEFNGYNSPDAWRLDDVTLTAAGVAPSAAGSVSISDVTISEGNSGTKVATFTITRSGGTAAFDVNFATSNGTATITDNDYAAASNTLHFLASQNTQTISVTINGDTKVEGNETFNVALSNATNGASIGDGQGIGTITNDDGEAPPIFSEAADTVTLPSLGGTFNALGGDDKLFYTGGWVTIDGGAGSDTIDFSRFGSAVRLDQSSDTTTLRALDSGQAIGTLSSVQNFVGTSSGDILRGTNNGNVIEGGRGNDMLSGNRGDDKFVFGGASGRDTITDFDDRGNDVIAISTALFADFSALQEALTDVGSDVVVAIDAQSSITLANTSFRSITETDFLFV